MLKQFDTYEDFEEFSRDSKSIIYFLKRSKKPQVIAWVSEDTDA